MSKERIEKIANSLENMTDAEASAMAAAAAMFAAGWDSHKQKVTRESDEKE